MRVISLKNFNQNIRILLQLLKYHNKVFSLSYLFIYLNKFDLILVECRINSRLESQSR